MSAKISPTMQNANNSNSFLKYLLIGCGGLALLAGVAVVGGIAWLAMQPEAGVKLGNKMDRYAVEYIEKHQILEPGEKILAYYDATMSMDGTEAAILTDSRLIQHVNGVNTFVRLAEVEDIRHRKETLIGDILEAEDASGTLILIEIAPLNSGETFKNAAMTAWRKAREGARNKNVDLN